MSDRKSGRDQRSLREAHLAASYYLDESDPDIAVLRRRDGTFVAAFSDQGATRESLVEAAREDYEASLKEADEGEEGAAAEEEG